MLRPVFFLNCILSSIHHQLPVVRTRFSKLPPTTSMTVSNGDNGDGGDLHGEHNQWKFRSPYKVHDNDPNFLARYEGSCHCGRIQYQISRDKPLNAKFCHCTTCQKLHGAPFQWAAIFHKTDINFTRGHHDLGWYDSSEKTCAHKLPCKVSCAYCRTPIMDEGRNMILLFPTLIDFKSEQDRKNFYPSCHMFYPRRVLDIPDGKPKWTGLNDKSELVAEVGQEAKAEAEAEPGLETDKDADELKRNNKRKREEREGEEGESAKEKTKNAQ